MSICCDECGKEATIIGKPEGVHWFMWMSDVSRGNDAVIAMPASDYPGLIGVICFACVTKIVQDHH